jgi:hypothetical protein
LCFSNFIFYLFQEKKGAKQRLYGKGKGQVETKDERQSPHRPQQSIINFDNFEASNKGKYEKIYPPNDKHLHEMYDVFLAGSNSAFQHSFDMKVKDTIAKVREDRIKQQLEKTKNNKVPQQKAHCLPQGNLITPLIEEIHKSKKELVHIDSEIVGGATLGINEAILEGIESIESYSNETLNPNSKSDPTPMETLHLKEQNSSNEENITTQKSRLNIEIMVSNTNQDSLKTPKLKSGLNNIQDDRTTIKEFSSIKSKNEIIESTRIMETKLEKKKSIKLSNNQVSDQGLIQKKSQAFTCHQSSTKLETKNCDNVIFNQNTSKANVKQNQSGLIKSISGVPQMLESIEFKHIFEHVGTQCHEFQQDVFINENLDIDELDVVSNKEEKQDAVIVETNMILERNNTTPDLQIAPLQKSTISMQNKG